MNIFDDHTEMDECEPRDTACRLCGKQGLVWEHDGDTWVLMEQHHRIHRCDDKALLEAALDDFEDL